MKVSCSDVPVPSIHGVHSQLSQGWGKCVGQGALDCAGLRPHTLIAPLAHQKASCRESPPPLAPQELQNTPYTHIPALSLPYPQSCPHSRSGC